MEKEKKESKQSEELYCCEGKEGTPLTERTPAAKAEASLENIREEKQKEKKEKKGRKGQNTAGKRPEKKSNGELAPFLAFAEDLNVDWDPARVEVRKGQVYYVPAESAAVRGLVFLRNGLYLGEIRKDRFEPSQALAVSLKKSQYRHTIDLPADDPRILHYLKGETIEIQAEEAETSKGWQLLCVSGYPLGWGKLVNGLLKNKFLASWRVS